MVNRTWTRLVQAAKAANRRHRTRAHEGLDGQAPERLAGSQVERERDR
jgi:hypothetical protein